MTPMKCLFSFSLLIIITYGYECPYLVNKGAPCHVPSSDIEEWESYPRYNCSQIEPISRDEAMTVDRFRKNVLTLTSDEINALQIALSCAQDLPADKNHSDENPWGFATTMHGDPYWFVECENSTIGNVGGGNCCPHSNPNFLHWHRIFLLHRENSMLRWMTLKDPYLGFPYWDWTNYPYTQLPELVTKKFYEIDGVKYRSPWWNYKTPQNVIAAYPSDSCEYTCRNVSNVLFSFTNPDNDDSFYKQTILSLKFKNTIQMSYAIDIPHYNVHHLLGGNMRFGPSASFDPIFHLHHSQIDRILMIWQKITEKINIDYRDQKVQNFMLGCLATYFNMNAKYPPFYNWADDIVTTHSFQGFTGASQYQDMPLSYDTISINGATVEEIIKEIDIEYDENKKQQERLIIGFYVIYPEYPYEVEYEVRNLATDEIVFNSFWSMWGGLRDVFSKDLKNTQHLYHVDISHKITDFNNYHHYYVTYKVKDLERNIYVDNDLLYHPIIIYRNTYGKDHYNLYVNSKNNKYNRNKLVLGRFDSHYDDNFVCAVNLIHIDNEKFNTNLDLDKFSTTAVHEAFKSSHFLSSVKFEEIDSDLSISRATLLFKTSNVDNSNNVLSKNFLNKIYYDGNVFIELYQSKNAFHGYDTNILKEPGSSNNKILPIAPLVDTGRPDNDVPFSDVVMVLPWELKFLKNDLYNNIYPMTHIDLLSFVQCTEDNNNLPCLVPTLDDYLSCNLDNATCATQFDVEEEGYYYFISADEDYCHFLDFKIGIYNSYVVDDNSDSYTITQFFKKFIADYIW